MSEWSMGYFVGVLAAVAVIVVVMLIRKKMGKVCEYDERQMIGRGKAYKAAFFTLLFYMMLDGCLATGMEAEWGDTASQMFVGICLSLLVFVSVALKNDAYLSMSESAGRISIVFALIGGLNLVLGVKRLISGEMVVNGALTFHSMNLMLGVLFVILLVEIIVKKMIDNRKGGE